MHEPPLHRLGALLARWHCWRRHYRTERAYARPGTPSDPEDALEELLMRSIEDEIGCLPMSWQRMLQQVAQAECLGVQVADGASPEYSTVLDHLAHRLRNAGVL